MELIRKNESSQVLVLGLKIRIAEVEFVVLDYRQL